MVQYKVKNSSNSRRVTSQISAPQPKLPKSKSPDDEIITISDDDAAKKPPKVDPIIISDDEVLRKTPKVDPIIIVLTDEEYEQTATRKKPRLKRRRRFVFTSSSDSDANEEETGNTSKTVPTDKPVTTELSNTTGFVLSRDSSDSEKDEEPTKEDIDFIDDRVARDETEFCHAAVKFDTSDDESPLQIEEPEEHNA